MNQNICPQSLFDFDAFNDVFLYQKLCEIYVLMRFLKRNKLTGAVLTQKQKTLWVEAQIHILSNASICVLGSSQLT